MSNTAFTTRPHCAAPPLATPTRHSQHVKVCKCIADHASISGCLLAPACDAHLVLGSRQGRFSRFTKWDGERNAHIAFLPPRCVCEQNTLLRGSAEDHPNPCPPCPSCRHAHGARTRNLNIAPRPVKQPTQPTTPRFHTTLSHHPSITFTPSLHTTRSHHPSRHLFRTTRSQLGEGEEPQAIEELSHQV